MKKLLSLLISVISICTLIGCNSSSTSIATNEKEEEKATDTAIALGESADGSTWNIKINKVEDCKVLKGHDASTDVKANGKFIAIWIDFKNISSTANSYSFHDFRILDSTTNKEYSVQDNVVEASSNCVSEEKYYKKNPKFITLNDNVNPDDTKTGAVVFDVDESLKLENLYLLHKESIKMKKAIAFKLS